LSTSGRSETILVFAPDAASKNKRARRKIHMPTMRFLTNVFTVLAMLTFALGARQAGGEPYPARAITFVVAFAAGGVADTLARFIGKGLGERLGRDVIVENRGGDRARGAPSATSCSSPPPPWRSTKPCA
jgi:hypothetical protein